MRVDGSSAPLNPGALRHLLTIRQKPSGAENTFGENTGEYATFATVYGSIRPLQGRELQAAQQRWADARFRIETQYLAGVTTAMDILDDEDRVLDILDVEDPEGCHNRLIMYCNEVK